LAFVALVMVLLDFYHCVGYFKPLCLVISRLWVG